VKTSEKKITPNVLKLKGAMGREPNRWLEKKWETKLQKGGAGNVKSLYRGGRRAAESKRSRTEEERKIAQEPKGTHDMLGGFRIWGKGTP